MKNYLLEQLATLSQVRDWKTKAAKLIESAKKRGVSFTESPLSFVPAEYEHKNFVGWATAFKTAINSARYTLASWDTTDIAQHQAEFLLECLGDNFGWLPDENMEGIWAKAKKRRKTHKSRVKWFADYLEQHLDIDDLQDRAFVHACKDSDHYQFEWEHVCDTIGEAIRDKGLEGVQLAATVHNFGWMRQDGEKVFRVDEKSTFKLGQSFLSEILPNTDCTFTVYTGTDKDGFYISIKNAHHDAPTGETYEIREYVELPDFSYLTGKWQTEKGMEVEINTDIPYIAYGAFFAQGEHVNDYLQEILDIYEGGNYTPLESVEQWVANTLADYVL